MIAIKKVDSLWKGILEDIFPDFIRFIQPDVDEILDLDRGFVFLDKELEQVFPPDNEEYSPSQVDKLVKVFTREGHEEYILLHIEVQGKYTSGFGKRMFAYYYRLLDKYDKRISAYAIFTEATDKPRTAIYSTSFMGTDLSYKFNTYKITGPTDAQLLASDNPFAIVVMAARTAFAGRHIRDSMERDHFIKGLKLKLIKQLYSRKFERTKIEKILKFIIFYIRFENNDTKRIFEKKLNILTNKRYTMGIHERILEQIKIEAKEEAKEEARKEAREEVRKEVREEVKEELIRNFIKNLKYTEEFTAEILQVPLEFVKKACY